VRRPKFRSKTPKRGNLAEYPPRRTFTCIFRAGTNAARPVWIRLRIGLQPLQQLGKPLVYPHFRIGGVGHNQRGAGSGPRPDFVSELAGALGRLGCLSVIGRTSRLPCCPRSHIASLARYAREAHPEGPIGLRPREGPPIAGLEVLFASREYAPPPVRFPARKSATIVIEEDQAMLPFER
jgi:hypothetical protein